MGGMLLGVSGGGGVSEGNMSGSSHGSGITTLPYKPFFYDLNTRHKFFLLLNYF